MRRDTRCGMRLLAFLLLGSLALLRPAEAYDPDPLISHLNLADVQSASASRVNLGLGTIATLNAPLVVGSGGTGLTASGANGNILTSNGSTWISQPFPAGVSSNQPITNTSAIGINSSNAANYCGKTLQLGGGAFYAVTISAPAGFPANCLITVTNSDNRGKQLQVSGFSNRILWPGHTVTYAINGAVWSANPGTEPRFLVDCTLYPSICPQAGTGYSAFIYVDATSGNDSNDCLTGGAGACATLTGASHLVYSSFDFGNGGYPVISIGPANATLVGNIFQGPFPGAAVLFVVCSNNVTLTPTASGTVLQGSDGATMEVGYLNGSGGCKVDGTGVSGSTGVFAHQNIIDLNSITFGNFPSGSQMFADNNSSLHLNNSYIVAGSATNHVVVGPSSVMTQNGLTTVTFQGTPTINTLYTITGAGSFISLATSITFSGAVTLAQQCSINGPAAISKNSNTLPTGTAGCLTSNGGVNY